MANAVSPVSMPAGTPLAAPVYLVINDGSVVGSTNGVPVNIVAGTITAENPSVSSTGAAIPSYATQIGASDGTNLQQLLVESSSQRNLRVSLFNAGNEVAVDASGRISVLGITNALPAGTNVIGHTITDSGSVTQLATGTNSVGNVGAKDATGSAVPANAFYVAGNASTALASAASAGNLTGVMYDKFGRPVSLAGTIRDLRATQTTTISASTSETTIFTAVSSVFLDVVLILFSNTSTTATRVDLRDTTAGTVLGSVYVPAGDMRGFAVPGETIPQTSVNTNWTAQCSASITDLRVYVLVDKNK